MNKAVDPRAAGAASTISPDIATVLDSLDKPNPKQFIDDTINAEFRRENPAFAGLPGVVEHIEKQVVRLDEEAERHAREKTTADLLDHEFLGERPKRLSSYDLIQFYIFALAALLGVGMSMHVLACYISDSDVVSFLNGNYFGSLFMSALPAIAVLAFKARASLSGSDEAERLFYIRLFKCGLVALGVYVVAVSIVYAPHKVDLAAIQAALANGVEPDSWLSTVVKNVGENTVLGSQLCAETLLAPLAALKADMFHRSGRLVTAPLANAQIVHNAAIEIINARRSELARTLSEAQNELAVLGARKRARSDAAIAFYNNVTADLKKAGDDVVAKYGKGGSR